MRGRELKSMVMESIDFQDGSFGKELEKSILTIQEIPQTSNKYNSKEAQIALYEISKSIKFYTGFTCDVKFMPERNAAALAPWLIFKDRWWGESELYSKGNSSDISRAAEKFKLEGSVNLKTGKVSGFYSTKEFKVDVYLGEFFFNPKENFTPEEVTAILLHEVGHLFTNVEYANRMVLTNQVLAAISKTIIDKDSQKQKEIIIKAAGEILYEDEKVFSGLEELTDLKTSHIFFIDRMMKHNRSELNSHEYDDVSSEQLADQYAARHGYGRHLVYALDKFTGKQNVSLINKMQVLNLIFNLTLLPFLISAGFGLFGLLTILSSLIGGSYSSTDYTYDTMRVRYLRIREDIVNNLKNKNNNDEIKASLIKELEAIDFIIKDMEKIEETFYQKVSLFFSKRSRDIKNALQLQRDLEELSANNLFLSSAKLSTLTLK